MSFKKWIKNHAWYKCPNCHEYTISYWHKLSLSDYRYGHHCKTCGGKIKLPVWYTFLFVIELLTLFFVNVKLDLHSFQSALLITVFFIFIWLVQFPFIPIKSGTRQRYLEGNDEDEQKNDTV